MAILIAALFHVLRFGHLMHHRYNRNPLDRPDTYDPATTSRLRARLAFLGNVLLGPYLAELAAPIACWLPRPAIRRVIDRIYRSEDPCFAGRTACSSIRGVFASFGPMRCCCTRRWRSSPARCRSRNFALGSWFRTFSSVKRRKPQDAESCCAQLARWLRN
jgi:hypothetical protein